MTTPLSALMVEHIHDVLVAILLPFDETVNPSEHRSRDLIESAVGRPFHTVCDIEVLPSLEKKAAALFHSLACNHCFINGNKRTAVLSLDMFLAINNHILVMSSAEVYQLAKDTVTANSEGIPFDSVMDNLAVTISRSMIDVAIIDTPNFKNALGEKYERLEKQAKRIQEFAAVVLRSLPAV